MRSRLSLALTGEALSLSLSQAERPHGWLYRVRSLAGRIPIPAPANQASPASNHVVTLPVTLLGETLEDAWAILQKQALQDLRALELSVQLGLAHARLGLLHQSEESRVGTRPAAIEGYVQAWIRQMWGMDPATQIIRWDRVGSGNDILISCIDRSIFVELEAFAQRHDLRFVSCNPAVLSAMDLPLQSSVRNNAPCTLVWTESSATAQRAPLVQILHCAGSQPWALWRGWIPAPEHGDESDTALHGAIRRFGATSPLTMDAPLVFKHWDPAMQPSRSAGASR